MVVAGGGCGGGGRGGGGRRMGKQQVWPVNYEVEEASQRLVEAAERGDLRVVAECLADPMVDVNYAGAVYLKVRRVKMALREEASDEVRVEYVELRTDVSALFLAAHSGHLPLVRQLLRVGVDVNQKMFRGYAMTAATREGRVEVVEVLLKAGASQPACEEAVVEACCNGWARLAELLMGSDLVRPHVAVHALVFAAARGFVDVVDTLIKCGVDPNATDRMLLRSCKPTLHIYINCTALVAAIIGRQVAVVRRLLQAGLRMDTEVRLGAWTWDTATGDEFRVGAGLAEPYNVAWCAVEYFESTGTILRLLLQHYSPNTVHLGRTLLHHAILCANPRAVRTLLACGADFEFPEFPPIHMATRLGHSLIVQILIDQRCDLNSSLVAASNRWYNIKNYRGETALSLARINAELGNEAENVISAGRPRWGGRKLGISEESEGKGGLPGNGAGATWITFGR